MGEALKLAFLGGVVAVAAVAATVPASAQTVLSDYESSDAATKARANAAWRLAFRPSLQVLQQTVAVLRSGAPPTLPGLSEADGLIAAAAQAPETSARADLWHAAAILLGRPWSPGQELIGALSIAPSAPVVTGRSATLKLHQERPVSDAPQARYTVNLVKALPTSSATPQKGELVRQLASGTVKLRSASGGQEIALPLSGVPDGFYILSTRIETADGASDEIATSFHVVSDLARREANIRSQLESISGHEESVATALYPFELAHALNAGKREIIAYDFNAATAESERITKALAGGIDPVRQATGLQRRAYRFAPTGELVPYQLFVPSTWSADRKWPLVVALHGANLDEANMLGRANGQMQALAEARGVVVAAPLGYRINSGYGSQRGGIGRILAADPDRLKYSEADVLAVTDQVAAEYNVDPNRIYLTGNSMGGAGTWWIAVDHPERWAAVAPAAFGGVLPEDAAALAQVPVLAVVGEKDELGMRERVLDSVKALRAGGLRPGYLEILGGTHSSAFDIALPKIFDFFEQHTK